VRLGCYFVSSPSTWRPKATEGHVMKYVKYNVVAELRKARQGKPTSVPLGLVLMSATEGYPRIQELIAEAFHISD
jgi:hypothetical protein